MKFPHIFMLHFFVSTNLLFAQQPGIRPIFQVTGKVVEAETNLPLEYATLIFTPMRGNVTGGITDGNGNFQLDIPAGMYDIAVEFISYKTKKLGSMKITKDLSLGEIVLEPATETLAEVELIAEKSTVEVKLDKKIYNVGQDMTVKGGTASDVLDNVPSVSVDVEGNVSLRGNESVRILIDGKPSGMVGLNATDALRQLPADAIQKVEVITSPSARYDAEGTAGIINIILRKGKAGGFNSSISLDAGIPEKYGVSANLNYRATKFNVFSNLGYQYRNAPGEATFINYTTSLDQKLNEELRTYTRMRNSFNGNLGMEYYLTDKSSVTGSVLYRVAPGETDVDNIGYSYDTDQSITLETNRMENETEKDHVMEFALNFTQKFGSDDHKLTFDAKYESDVEEQSAHLLENEIRPTPSTISSEKTDNDENQKQWLFQADYVLPIGKEQQLEAGIKVDMNDNQVDYKLYEWDVLNTDVSNVFDYNEKIYAAYIQYGTKINQFSLLAGLRVEQTDLDASVENTILDFNKYYNNLFPTLNLSYELSETANITLGMNKRIRRPRSRHINPFPSRSSTTNIWQGNPAIDPVISNTFDIGYLKKWTKFSVNTSIYYQIADNAFQMVRIDTGETNENDIPIILTTPINLNKEDRLGTELSLTYNPTRKIRLSNSFNFFKYKTDGSYAGVNYTADDVSWFTRFSAKVGLTKKSDFQTTMFYMGPSEDSSSKRNGMFMANLAYSVDVLKDKGTISLNVSDLFNTRYREMNTYYDTFNAYSKFQWSKRQLNLTFTYRFNQKKKMERPSREDINAGDDIMG